MGNKRFESVLKLFLLFPINECSINSIAISQMHASFNKCELHMCYCCGYGFKMIFYFSCDFYYRPIDISYQSIDGQIIIKIVYGCKQDSYKCCSEKNPSPSHKSCSFNDFTPSTVRLYSERWLVIEHFSLWTH